MHKNSLNNLKKAKRFDKHPEFINKNGRPEKVLATITDYIEKKYGKRPAKNEVLELLQYIECLPIDKLTEFVKDKAIPVILLAYGRLLLTGDQKELRRVQGAEMINDRIHGRPKQSNEINFGKNESININLKLDRDLEE